MISLTFDDAIPQHLDLVIPILNDCGLLGTFYAHATSQTLLSRWHDWADAATQGHELGNHTVFHPATERKAWVHPGIALESYCLDRMRSELCVANELLQAIDGQSVRTFAYPCSNQNLGRFGLAIRTLHRMGLERTRWPGFVERRGLDFGSTRQSYAPLVEGMFMAGRSGGLQIEQTPPPLATFSRGSLLSAAVEGHSFEVMKAFVERSVTADSWAILQFHGVGGGHHMDCDLIEFRRLIEWLAEHHANAVVTVVQGARTLFVTQTREELYCGPLASSL